MNFWTSVQVTDIEVVVQPRREENRDLIEAQVRDEINRRILDVLSSHLLNHTYAHRSFITSMTVAVAGTSRKVSGDPRHVPSVVPALDADVDLEVKFIARSLNLLHNMTPEARTRVLDYLSDRIKDM